VLYNFTSTKATISTHVGNVLNEALLAPSDDFNLDGKFDGGILGGGGTIVLMSGTEVNQPECRHQRQHRPLSDLDSINRRLGDSLLAVSLKLPLGGFQPGGFAALESVQLSLICGSGSTAPSTHHQNRW
jgi:hypothetical protein